MVLHARRPNEQIGKVQPTLARMDSQLRRVRLQALQRLEGIAHGRERTHVLGQREQDRVGVRERGERRAQDRLSHLILAERVGDEEGEPRGRGRGVLGVAKVVVQPFRPRGRIDARLQRRVVVESSVAHHVAILVDGRYAERGCLDHRRDLKGSEALVRERRVIDELLDRRAVVELGAAHEDSARRGHAWQIGRPLATVSPNELGALCRAIF